MVSSKATERLRRLEAQALAFEERLAPIANQPVVIDTSVPGWNEKPKNWQHPLDAAGLRGDMELFLEEAIELYKHGTEHERKAIRQLFRQCGSLAWAADWSFSPGTPDGFEKHLLLFSVQNQGRDPRDAVTQVQRLCQEAKAGGVDTRPILERVAALSDDQDRLGMGSTRKLLLRQTKRFIFF